MSYKAILLPVGDGGNKMGDMRQKRLGIGVKS
jgi:hypothetical protein